MEAISAKLLKIQRIDRMRITKKAVNKIRSRELVLK
jgi:hypothetical protein